MNFGKKFRNEKKKLRLKSELIDEIHYSELID